MVDFITTERTWYVHNVNGNDANDGETEATAFKTVQFAIDALTAAHVFMAMPTIRLLTSGVNYAPINLKRWAGSAQWFRITGDPANMRAAVIGATVAGTNAITSSHVMTPWRIENLEVGAQSYGVLADGPAHVVLQNICFNYCGASHMGVLHGAFMEMLIGDYKVVGGANSHIGVAGKAHFHMQSNNIIFENNPGMNYVVSASLWALAHCGNLWGSSGARNISVAKYYYDGTGQIVSPSNGWP